MSHVVKIASNDGLQSYYGKIVPKDLIPTYVVLSVIISYLGTWTAVELINRRTSSKGLYNWLLLGGAAISMGGIGIWCMHFIGNRAIILGDGSVALQISYNGALTAVSFFIPIIVLFFAFAAVGSSDKTKPTRLFLGGTLMGLGACAMHYLGQAAVTNYDCIYYVAYVIGAAIIAITAGTAALGLLFVFRAAWSAAWWRRAICAAILAGAVSGLHWLASSGTHYRFKENSGFTSTTSRNAMTISIIAMSVATCLSLFLWGLFAQIQKKRSGDRATQITLAAAVFDQDGKVMVKGDGLLPIRKITDSFRETDGYRDSTFNDSFSIAHPAYLWMYRASRNWGGISNLVVAMKDHLNRTGLRRRFGRGQDDTFGDHEDEQISDYSLIFREHFCVAAAELADDMKHPVDKLGKLYDDIICTGKKPAHGKKDVENATQESIGKGQIMFLVRVVDDSGALQLQRAGFRFAPKQRVLTLTAGTLQMDEKDLERHLEIMFDFSVAPPFLDPGCHLALFAIRASMTVGFDVLIRQDARNLIPTMQLPFDTLESWQVDYLQTMDSQTVAATMKRLNKASRAAATPPREKTFAAQLLHSLEAFKDEIDDPFFNDAMLVAKPTHSACRGPTNQSRPGTCTLIAFRAIIPIGSRAPGRKLDFTPLIFLKKRQHVYLHSPDHEVFARRAFREYARVLGLSARTSIASHAGKRQSEIDAEVAAMTHMTPPTPFLDKPSQAKHGFFGRRNSPKRGENSSERPLMDASEDQVSAQEGDVGARNRHTNSTDDGGLKPGGVEMKRLSKASTNVSKHYLDEEQPSFVDELFKITVQTRKV